jgi:hypothetical protein
MPFWANTGEGADFSAPAPGPRTQAVNVAIRSAQTITGESREEAQKQSQEKAGAVPVSSKILKESSYSFS